MKIERESKKERKRDKREREREREYENPVIYDQKLERRLIIIFSLSAPSRSNINLV